MFVFLNKYAAGGRARNRWNNIQAELRERFPDENYFISSDITNLHREIQERYLDGERLFIAAGGDGTVNTLMNELLRSENGIRENAILGAIGLGSSNDFHKPFSASSYINGRIPCRLDNKNVLSHNAAEINFIDASNAYQTRHFLINCSLGIVAYANYLFNDQNRIIKFLKRFTTAGAIWYAGLKSLVKYENARCVINLDGKKIDTYLSNLGILIKPNFSGNFRYDIEVGPQSDFLAIALCENMNMWARLNAISSLANGKFRGLPDTHIWQGNTVAINSNSFMPLEFDGEVVMAKDIKIKLIKAGLRVCA